MQTLINIQISWKQKMFWIATNCCTRTQYHGVRHIVTLHFISTLSCTGRTQTYIFCRIQVTKKLTFLGDFLSSDTVWIYRWMTNISKDHPSYRLRQYAPQKRLYLPANPHGVRIQETNSENLQKSCFTVTWIESLKRATNFIPNDVCRTVAYLFHQSASHFHKNLSS